MLQLSISEIYFDSNDILLYEPEVESSIPPNRSNSKQQTSLPAVRRLSESKKIVKT